MADLVQLKSSIKKPDGAGDSSATTLLSSSAPQLLSASSPTLPVSPSPTLPVSPSPTLPLSPQSSALSPASPWRSLEELANSHQFQEIVHREFPQYASEWTDD